MPAAPGQPTERGSTIYADQSSTMPGFAIFLVLLFYAAIIAFAVYCYVRVARKAGYSGWYAALCFVPIANLVVLLIFVFQEWPIERELRELRALTGRYPQQGGYPSAAGYPAPAGGYPAPQAYGITAAPIPPWEQRRPGVSTDPRFATPPSPYDQGPGTPPPYDQGQGTPPPPYGPPAVTRDDPR